MATAFENFVNTELPKRIGFSTIPPGGNAQAGRIVKFTGVGLNISEQNLYARTFIVSTDPTIADYSSIIEAVANIPGDITRTYPFYILVEPGTYNETGRLNIVNVDGLFIMANKNDASGTRSVNVTFSDTENAIYIEQSRVTFVGISITQLFIVPPPGAYTLVRLVAGPLNVNTVNFMLVNTGLVIAAVTPGNIYDYTVISAENSSYSGDNIYVNLSDKANLGMIATYASSYKLINSSNLNGMRLSIDNATLTCGVNASLLTPQILINIPTVNSVPINITNSRISVTSIFQRGVQRGALMHPLTYFNVYSPLNQGSKIEISNTEIDLSCWSNSNVYAIESSLFTIFKNESSSKIDQFLSKNNTLKFAPPGLSTNGNPKYTDFVNSGSGSFSSIMDSLAGASINGIPITSFVSADTISSFKTENLRILNDTANRGENRVNGKSNTTYSPLAPINPRAGDLWVRTSEQS